jgi:hypothetical protein
LESTTLTSGRCVAERRRDCLERRSPGFGRFGRVDAHDVLAHEPRVHAAPVGGNDQTVGTYAQADLVTPQE